MIIRKARIDELDKIMQIYSAAQLFMHEQGNPDQWGRVYPPRELIETHIGTNMYVCEYNGDIACVFYYAIENDPTYSVIESGSWLSNQPYGVVHRIASSHIVKGAARFCLTWAFDNCKNLRIDTHRDNIPMQNLLSSLGFTYCGIIHLENGDERIAFQKEA